MRRILCNKTTSDPFKSQSHDRSRFESSTTVLSQISIDYRIFFFIDRSIVSLERCQLPVAREMCTGYYDADNDKLDGHDPRDLTFNFTYALILITFRN